MPIKMEFITRINLFTDIYLMVVVLMQLQSCALSTNQPANPSGPSDQPEAYFNGSSYIRLQTTINLKKHTAFSFKSCTGGELFSQIHNDNIISLSLIPTTLTLSISPSNTAKHDTSIPGDYVDNRWHTVQLLYRLGNLTLHVDNELPRLVANATYHNEVLTSPGLYNDGAVLIVGNHYIGCLMEGPSVVFDNAVGYGHNVVFGACPIPDDSCVVKQDLLMLPASSAPSSGSSAQSRADFCLTEPCMRHGTCINSLTSYTCVCAPRYTGKNCEFDLGNPCEKKQPPVCKNGGICTDDPTGNYRCTCPPGFSGKGCEIEVVIDKLCVPNPCQSGGTCSVSTSLPPPSLATTSLTNAPSTIECACAPGFAGVRCETNINECASGPCRHGGVCIDGPANYTCDCARTGYTGAHCERNVNECNNKEDGAVCRNGGTCYDTYGGYLCECAAGWNGHNCDVTVNDCLSHPCRNHGSCEALTNGGFECHCLAGYGGATCDVESRHGMNQCDNALCGPHAECREIRSTPTCVCKPAYTGDYPNCLPSTICQVNPCLNGGICSPWMGSYNCTCPIGFTGERCHINIDDCVRMPCKNGGTCIDKINDFHCNCSENWMGATCEKAYDACELNLCQNNATCTTSAINKKDFTCACLSGFEGVHCDINIDDCVGVTCPAGKNCFDLVDSYECRCPTGLTGEMCNIEVDPCSPNPCISGGSCNTAPNTSAGFMCTCPPAHTGVRCETLLSSSSSSTSSSHSFGTTSSPQEHNNSGASTDTCSALGPAICNQGICVNRPNITAGFQCYCQPGYTGERCDLDFDECLSQPCRNAAVCKNRVNNYECECTPGYAGKDCSININECESMPCMAGSTCIDGINEFSCLCVPGLTGKVCEINIDDCMSSPCLNGATCLDELNAYSCDCTDTGYTGLNCEQNIDDCILNPCTHGSVCVDLVRDYRCDCHPGYSGKNCLVDIDECESLPCKYGGLCLERSNVTLYDSVIQASLNLSLPSAFKKAFDYEDADGYECLCVVGVTGPNCEININECESNPCQYGACVDRIGSYLCECDEGFEGINCEIDIDECAVMSPCVHGECVDKRANYFCVCEASYGGKNCSVELTGCVENPCLNNGTCKPYLDNETQHKFNCTCQNGFRGATCEMVSTMSLNGNSLVTVNTTRDEGYDIQFRFKTTLPDGVLAVGRGLTFYILELSRGRLNLHSSLLNKWEGVFVGSHLNDSRWQRVFVAINASHLVLSANDEQTIYPITFNENSNGSVTSFPTTYIGGYPNYLRKLTHSQPFLVGCTEDVVINGEWVLPDASTANVSSNNSSAANGQQVAAAATLAQSVSAMSFLQVEVGCQREPQCTPNPCHSGGHCTDRWRNFSCTCERPYLGHICQYTYIAATFGHENITDSLVTVTVTDIAKRAVRSIVDISMFVRTRQLRGQIFYLGSALGGSSSSGSASSGGPSVGLLNESYIAAQLENGELFVRIQFNGTVEAYTVGGVKLNNGYNHLIEVIRNVTLVQVKLNGTEYFRKTISATGTLDAQVLYLGGQPQLRPVRQAENTVKPEIISATGPAAASTQLTTVHFKGIIQDVQISDGSKVMVVEFFPLQADEIVIPMPFGVVTFDNTSVLEGVLSDNSCEAMPCHRNGKCFNTWNDYRCVCPKGFKGKDCKELEFCELEECPPNSQCRNIEDGYECLANATFDASAKSAPLQYRFFTTKPVSIDSIEVTYRSRSWGTVLFAKHEDLYMTIFVAFDEVVVEGNVWAAGKIDRRRFRKGRFDGDWTTILLKGSKDGTMKGGFKDLVLDDTPNFVLPEFDATNFTKLFTRGTIFVAGSDNQTFDYTDILLQGGMRNASSYVTLIDLTGDNMGISTNTVEFGPDAAQWTSGYKVDVSRTADMFKGCLGEIHVGPYLLPYFPPSVLFSKTTPEDYYHLLVPADGVSAVYITTGCSLCHALDCYNGGRCISAADTYKCTCPVGYAADDCSIDIDECVGNVCRNGATCIDLVGKYACQCVLGYRGDHCEAEINECESHPCHHGGECVDLLGTFRCDCSEDYVGKQCEALRLITCDNLPCKEGATCSNIKNENYPDANFTCICAPGMIGRLCDLPFCSQQHCENGGVCNVTSGGMIPPRCDCARGFEGRLCERNIDDCILATGGSPCQNGGVCVDGVNRYDCNCTGTGFTGLLCEMDIDECNQLATACGPGTCRNIPGSFVCTDCPPGLCGHVCALEDPCLLQPCLNDGFCADECREQVNYECQCKVNWAGKNCTVNVLLKAEEVNGLNILYIAIPVVAVVLVGVGVALAILVNVARSKRATRGTYSPSAQEFCNPRVELDHVLKPPPEERLI